MKVRWEDMEAYVASEFAKGKESVAYSLNHPVIFSRPVSIEEYGLRGAPQSYVYLEDFQ